LWRRKSTQDRTVLRDSMGKKVQFGGEEKFGKGESRNGREHHFNLKKTEKSRGKKKGVLP